MDFVRSIFISCFALDIRGCVRQCQDTGCVGQRCFPNCKSSSDGELIDRPWYMQQEPLYLQWKKWDCQSDCRYYCMLDRENERESHNLGPVKYHGKWPFRRIYGMQVCQQRSHTFVFYIFDLVSNVLQIPLFNEFPCIILIRNLLLWLSQLSILHCIFMVGSPFSFMYTINCL